MAVSILPMPQFRAAKQGYNFAPVNQGLNAVRQQQNQSQNMMLRKEQMETQRDQFASQQGLQRERMAQGASQFDARMKQGAGQFDQSHGLQKKRFGLESDARKEHLKSTLTKRFAGVAQLVGKEADPAKRAQMWQQFTSTDPRILSGMPEQLRNDPVAGAQFIIAQARGYQDPLQTRLNEAKIKGFEAKAVGARLGKPPTGYRFNQDGSLTAIPGGPATKMGSEVAGKVALMHNGLQELPKAREIFKKIGAGGRANMILNRGNAGEARRIVQTLVEAQLRALTGAAATEQETERLMNFYGPVSTDTGKTMTSKLDRLASTVRNSIRLMQTGRVSYDAGNRLDALIPKTNNTKRLGQKDLSKMSTEELMELRKGMIGGK